jgi:alkylhydroperoxidase family enzyme
VPAHSALAARAGLGAVDRELRAGGALSDPRHEALRGFVRTLVHERGRVPSAAQEAFTRAGYGRRQALEAIVAVALKTISNYTNHLAMTPVDAAFLRAAG